MYVSRADARYVVQYLWEVGGSCPLPHPSLISWIIEQ
jgi:hypothetical protein